MGIEVLSQESADYELVDSGNRRKLERFGGVYTVRSEPKAWWRPLYPKLWEKADCVYDDESPRKHWEFLRPQTAPVLDFDGIKFCTKFMDGSKHLGVFPEQLPHWRYITDSAKLARSPEPNLLNLFGYTGAASLFAARAGYAVTHVDASRPSVEWARKNQQVSGLQDCRIRWIVDDALKFAARQLRRGVKYDAIVLDPPAFGRGPKGELWKLEKMLPQLLQVCSALLSKNPVFVLMTIYSIDASSIMAANMLREYFGRVDGFSLSYGELSLKPKSGYELPLSIWARAQFA